MLLSLLPFAKRLLDDLSRASVRAEVFDRVEPNPKGYNVAEAAKAAQEMKAGGLIALGGGSPIDCAKAAAVVASLGGRVRY